MKWETHSVNRLWWALLLTSLSKAGQVSRAIAITAVTLDIYIREAAVALSSFTIGIWYHLPYVHTIFSKAFIFRCCFLKLRRHGYLVLHCLSFHLCNSLLEGSLESLLMNRTPIRASLGTENYPRLLQHIKTNVYIVLARFNQFGDLLQIFCLFIKVSSMRSIPSKI